jgi:hypothetical protein
MFRTSYVLLQEGYIVHASIYGMFSMNIEHILNTVEYLHRRMDNINFLSMSEAVPLLPLHAFIL